MARALVPILLRRWRPTQSQLLQQAVFPLHAWLAEASLQMKDPLEKGITGLTRPVTLRECQGTDLSQ